MDNKIGVAPRLYRYTPLFMIPVAKLPEGGEKQGLQTGTYTGSVTGMAGSMSEIFCQAINCQRWADSGVQGSCYLQLIKEEDPKSSVSLSQERDFYQKE